MSVRHRRLGHVLGLGRVCARPARTDAFWWPQCVPRDIGHLPLAGQADRERVTAARCGRLTGQDAVVSLMRGNRLVRGDHLVRGNRLMRGVHLNGGADLSRRPDVRLKASVMPWVDLTRFGRT
jgi:hypothetical protein